MSKSQQDDFYTIDALSHISSIKVWMWIMNAFADAAYSNAFDAWSVFAHVTTNLRRAENGYYRNGGPIEEEIDLPSLL